MYEQLIADLKEDGEWAEGNEWETPIMLSDHIKQAIEAIETLSKELDMTDAANTALYGALPKWIPVTELVPDSKRDVQITVFWHDAWRTMYGYYDGAFWHLYAPMHTEVADVEVIGWMEKPTPMPLHVQPTEDENNV